MATDTKEIKKKILNYARDYAFDKINKKLDKRLAKESKPHGTRDKYNNVQSDDDNDGRDNNDDYDDYDDNDGDLVQVSTTSQKELRKCQTYITNERRSLNTSYKSNHLHQQLNQRLEHQTMTKSSIVPSRRNVHIYGVSSADEKENAKSKRLNRISKATTCSMDDDDNYLTADDLYDDEKKNINDDARNDSSDDSTTSSTNYNRFSKNMKMQKFGLNEDDKSQVSRCVLF